MTDVQISSITHVFFPPSSVDISLSSFSSYPINRRYLFKRVFRKIYLRAPCLLTFPIYSRYLFKRIFRKICLLRYLRPLFLLAALINSWYLFKRVFRKIYLLRYLVRLITASAFPAHFSNIQPVSLLTLFGERPCENTGT